MAKIKTLLICLFWTFLSLSSFSSSINEHDRLIEKATSYIGVVEEGENNEGFSDKKFQECIQAEGWTSGDSWCSFFVKMILNYFSIPNTVTGWSPSSYNKKDVIYTDGEFKKEYSSNDILVMSLSYDKFKKNKTRYKGIGHTGIIEKVEDSSIITIEGNTNDLGTRDSRTGDGVYRKRRPLTKNTHITRWKKN